MPWPSRILPAVNPRHSHVKPTQRPGAQAHKRGRGVPQRCGRGGRSPSATTANTRSCRPGSVLPARLANMPFSSTMRSDVADPGADRACLLGATQQQVKRGEQILAQRAGDRDGIGQVALGGGLPGDPGEEAEERLAGVGGIGPRPRVADQIGDPRRDHRLEQRLLGREVPVDGAGPDPGTGRDLVQRHAVARFGERLPGGTQHLLPVPRRVGAQRPARPPLAPHPPLAPAAAGPAARPQSWLLTGASVPYSLSGVTVPIIGGSSHVP